MDVTDKHQIPDIAGIPAAIGSMVLIYEEDGFRVFATELEMMWRWDLFEGERHLHTGCAQRIESCIIAAQSKIRLFKRPTIALLLHSNED